MKIDEPVTEEKKVTEVKPPEIKTETKTEAPPVVETKKDEIEDAFSNFMQSKTKHEAPVQEEKHELENDDIDIGTQFKTRLFVGLFFLVLDGFHAFLYSQLSKYKITKEEMEMNAKDQEALEMYFQSPKVVAFINKLPEWIIGIAHTEYIYWHKFKSIVRTHEAKELKEAERKKALPKIKKKKTRKKKTETGERKS